ncbi:HK97 gp10 family phage protein [Bacillus paranthracis]|uniref:HK97 gp10 family phage protein n=1 Tax=Bacillus paranthracis TaxID=2026186 RepID=UPI0020B74C36|nr:HK97 gp10 family phage protein [Bacillus paranthracis]
MSGGMEGGFVLEGFDEWMQQMRSVVHGKIPQMLELWAEALALQLMSMVVEKTPVDTEALRNSFLSAGMGVNGDGSVFLKAGIGDGIEIVVGSNLFYAEYVEAGHRKRNSGKSREEAKESGDWVEGAHMLEDSWHEFEPEALRWLEDRVGEIMNELGFV